MTPGPGGPARGVFGGDARSPSKLPNRQLPRRRTGLATRELPARPGRPERQFLLRVTAPPAPARAHRRPALLAAGHTAAFLREPSAAAAEGSEGGSPARRARCQGRPDLHGARAGGLARSALGPAHRSPSARTRSALWALPQPRSVHSGRRPLTRTRRSLPLGPERRPGSSRPGGRSRPRAGGRGCGEPEWRPARPGAGRAGCRPGRTRAQPARLPGRPREPGTRAPRALLFYGRDRGRTARRLERGPPSPRTLCSWEGE